ncbi:MAG: DUF1580 domain-containing protein [Planctomycetes bacterium]|nr:DUF1580 domain-containing protein [Planctomycetota bacterium]
MIDLSAETVVSLTEATSFLPRRRRGKKPHVATLYRWAQHGVRCVRLETIQVGGTLCTSREALQRFCERLSNPEAAGSPTLRSPAARERAIERAGRELSEIGI